MSSNQGCTSGTPQKPPGKDDDNRSSKSKKSKRPSGPAHQGIRHPSKRPVVRASRREPTNVPATDMRVHPVIAAIPRKEKARTSVRSVKEDDPPPSSITAQTARCMHKWPTPADLARYNGRPIPAEQETPQKVNDIDFYYGRMPTWYIEEKMLKCPGDFLLSRDDNSNFILSVKSKEKGNPVVHFTIEWLETRQVKGDRNNYYRVKGTLLQDHNIFGLIQQHRKSKANVLKQTLGRDVELLNPIIPCLNCVYTKCEYYPQFLFIRDRSEIVMGKQLHENSVRKVYEGMRTIREKAMLVDIPIVRPVIVYEYADKSAEQLDAIYRELHIVQSVVYKLGWNTALEVEGIMASPNNPLCVVYRYCRFGSLKRHLLAHRDNIFYAERLFILSDILSTLYQMVFMGVLHCNLRAKNVFVDLNEHEKPFRMEYFLGAFHHSIMVKKDQNLQKKIDPKKLHNARWQAPEIHVTGTLDEKTEVYSFGMLMYEVLTTEMPYKQIPKDKIAKAIMSKPDMRPELPDTFPPETVKLISSCWHKEPEKRPTLKELWRSMREICSNTPNAA